MSEWNTDSQKRRISFHEFCTRLIRDENGRALFLEYENLLSHITPADVVIVFDWLVSEISDTEALKTGVSRILNLVYKSLTDYMQRVPDIDKIPFLKWLSEDNAKLREILADTKKLNLKINQNGAQESDFTALAERMDKIAIINKHYIIKENILFPILEKNFKDYRCISIMWSIQDDVRLHLKQIQSYLKEKTKNMTSINALLGKLFFDLHALAFREDNILFPVVLENLSPRLFDMALPEAAQIGFAFITPNTAPRQISAKISSDSHPIDLGSGVLSMEQIKLIFNHLPVDVTFVDENNRVRYFSTPKDRIFPRSVSIIGREVQNCHPPESVAIVNRIIESFKRGEKDHADFWLKIADKELYIRYFAVRNNKNEYKGVLEVSQEISVIKTLEGEKRLLDWI